MATIRKFEDLENWQLARQLNIKLLPCLKAMTEKREYELKNQLDSAAGSVMDNIAEGFERDGNKEFIQFLAISKGSLGEVRSQLYRVLDREFIGPKEFEVLQSECFLLAGKIGAFITYLRNSDFKGTKFKDKDKI
jgi:four helix bundle protein